MGGLKLRQDMTNEELTNFLWKLLSFAWFLPQCASAQDQNYTSLYLTYSIRVLVVSHRGYLQPATFNWFDSGWNL